MEDDLKVLSIISWYVNVGDTWMEPMLLMDLNKVELKWYLILYVQNKLKYNQDSVREQRCNTK